MATPIKIGSVRSIYLKKNKKTPQNKTNQTKRFRVMRTERIDLGRVSRGSSGDFQGRRLDFFDSLVTSDDTKKTNGETKKKDAHPIKR